MVKVCVLRRHFFLSCLDIFYTSLTTVCCTVCPIAWYDRTNVGTPGGPVEVTASTSPGLPLGIAQTVQPVLGIVATLNPYFIDLRRPHNAAAAQPHSKQAFSEHIAHK